jgi:hypothetical protein
VSQSEPPRLAPYLTQQPIKQVFVAEESLERGCYWTETESMVGGVVLLFFASNMIKEDFLSGLLIKFYLGGNFELY